MCQVQACDEVQGHILITGQLVPDTKIGAVDFAVVGAAAKINVSCQLFKR